MRLLGLCLATNEPRYGWSSGTPSATRFTDWPLSRLCIASKWLLMAPGWVIELISVNWSVTLASSVCIWLIRMPGTLVAMGLYGPRIVSGASGFMSQVSTWLGPPQSKRKMHDFSAGTALPLASSLSLPQTDPGRPSESAPRPPAIRACRRFSSKVFMESVSLSTISSSVFDLRIMGARRARSNLDRPAELRKLMKSRESGEESPRGARRAAHARHTGEIMMSEWRRTETANGDCFGWCSGHVDSFRSARVCGCFV